MPKFTPDLSKIEAGEPYELARKLLVEHVRQAADAKNITHREIADAIGMKRSSVSRVLSHKFPPTLDTFLKVTGYLGLELKIK